MITDRVHLSGHSAQVWPDTILDISGKCMWMRLTFKSVAVCKADSSWTEAGTGQKGWPPTEQGNEASQLHSSTGSESGLGQKSSREHIGDNCRHFESRLIISVRKSQLILFTIYMFMFKVIWRSHALNTYTEILKRGYL